MIFQNRLNKAVNRLRIPLQIGVFPRNPPSFLMSSGSSVPSLYHLQAAVRAGSGLPAPDCGARWKITAEALQRRIPENDAARQPSRRGPEPEGKAIGGNLGCIQTGGESDSN